MTSDRLCWRHIDAEQFRFVCVIVIFESEFGVQFLQFYTEFIILERKIVIILGSNLLNSNLKSSFLQSGDLKCDLKGEALANFAGGVISGVLRLSEFLGPHNGSNGGVPGDHLDGNEGDRDEAIGAAKDGEGVADDGGDEEVTALGAGTGDKVEELVRGSELGDDDDVAGYDGADVAVEGVDGERGGRHNG